ncbi:MAG: NACHT domain-containing protein, partial [Waterburya sp.]
MVDLLTAWGVTSAAGFIFKPILQDLYQELKELTKDATEDWVKDFFKERLSTGSKAGYGKFLSRIHREPLDIAAGKAIKGFLEIIQDCLDDMDLDEQAIANYTDSIKQLLKDKSVRQVLGDPFQEDVSYLDTKTLQETWESLNLLALPDDFDWDKLARKYLKKVKAIYQESDELKEILQIQLQQQTADSLEQIAGIKTDFNLVKYQETILEKYGNLKLESLDSSGYIYDKELKIYQIFIPQNVKECQEYLPQVYELPKDLQRKLKARGELESEISLEELESYKRAYSDQRIRSVLEVIGDDQYKYLVILGDPGAGKSTLLQYLAVEWAKIPPKNLPSHPLTLLVELRSYIQDFKDKRCQNFLEFIHKGSSWICHLDQIELDKRLKRGEVRVLFDGLDEVFDPQQRSNVIAQIHSFTQTYSQAKVIVTSRIIGYKPQQLKDAEFHHFMLQDLEPKQIEDFLQKWHNLTYSEATESQKKQDRQQRITKAIEESPAIQQLAANPLLLTMMAILNRNQDLPRDRAKLYERSSELLLYQWDVEAKLLEDPELKSIDIDYQDKQAMLREVAHFMQATEKGLAGNLISQQDLQTVLIQYLNTIDVKPTRKVARLMIEQLRTRNFILCDIGSNYYAFVHRTFLEYFCAWWYIWQLEAQKITIEQIKTEVFGNHWQDESWHEVLRLIAGMILEPKNVGEIIEYLLAQNGESANFANLFLAADCLAEVRNRKPITGIADKLLEKLKQFAQQSRQLIKRIEQEDLNAKLSKKIINAIATNWKNEPNTLIWLKTCLKFDSQSYVSQSAVRAIAREWHDNPDTLPWLKQRAQSDGNEYVRSIAVQELARGWHDDPDTLPILKQHAQSDGNSVVRSIAIQELARGWHDDPDTLPILQQRAKSDNSYYFRSTAVQELARGWHDDPDTLRILQQRAQCDAHQYVRSTAVEELARGLHTHPEIFDLLVNCTVKDLFVRSQGENAEHETNPRQTALEKIMEYFPRHPQTKDLLLD